MIENLPNGNLNFEGLEVAVVSEPIKNGAVGRITLTAPILNKDCEKMISFFEDHLTIIELEIIFNAVIISKRVWVAYDSNGTDGKIRESAVPVIFADYECRSRDVFAKNFKDRTVKSIHIIDSNDIIEMGLAQGKYTADIFMCSSTEQIPSFTNSSFQSNISMIFLDNQGDLPSFVIRKVIPFIEQTISSSVIPSEYDVLFEHHIISVGNMGETISIVSTPCGIKVNDSLYSISECTPEIIAYNPDVWSNEESAELFKTLVRTTFANGDHFHYPIFDKDSLIFRMRPITRSSKKSVYRDRIVYEIPECVAIRFIREEYRHMPIQASLGIFDYTFNRRYTVRYGDICLEVEVYHYNQSLNDLAKDLRLPRLIVKVDRDSYDKFYKKLPVSEDPSLLNGWKWLAEDIHEHFIMSDTRYELLVSDLRDMIIGYW